MVFSYIVAVVVVIVCVCVLAVAAGQQASHVVFVVRVCFFFGPLSWSCWGVGADLEMRVESREGWFMPARKGDRVC